MQSRLVVALLLLAVSLPLGADLTGITTRPANLPSAPSEMTVGTDGNLWILTVSGNLGRYAPGGAYVEFPLPWGKDQFGIPYAQNLTSGIDGNLWVTGFNGHIARVTPTGGVTDFAVGPGFFPPPLIVSGSDGALWFVDRPAPGPGASNAWKLGRIDILGQVTTYDLGISNDQLRGLISGGDGNLWMIDETTGKMVKFSIVTKSVAATYTIPSPSNQNGDDQTVLGLDGNIWFTRGTGIDCVTPDGTFTEFKTSSGNQTSGIVVAGDGNIWFTEYTAGKLGQLVTSSITSGGSATINESGAILTNGFTIFVLPPEFANASGKTGALDVKPCPALTFIVKITPPTSGEIVSTTAQSSPCADIKSDITFFSELDKTPSAHTTAFITVSNVGPNDASELKSVVAFTAPSGTAITKVQTSASDVLKSISFGSMKVTAYKDSLPFGTHFWFAVEFSSRVSLSGTDVSTSAIADPKPSNNAAAGMFTGSAAVALQPDPNSLVAVPVTRGK